MVVLSLHGLGGGSGGAPFLRTALFCQTRVSPIQLEPCPFRICALSFVDDLLAQYYCT
jgi:hypothetical protein